MATHQKKHVKNKGEKELLKVEDPIGQVYAVVKSALGNCTFTCTLLNGEEIRSSLCGRMMRNKSQSNMVRAGDFVLLDKEIHALSPPSYEIKAKYTESERKELAKQGQIVTSQVRANTNGPVGGTQVLFEGEQAAEGENEDDKEINIDDI
jgi:translation initiation factor IF-1